MTTLSIAQCLMEAPISRSESRLLLQHILGLTASQLITHQDERLPEKKIKQFNQLVKRRIDGEPIAYLVGKKEFYSRSFIVTPDVLIPRPETELLVEIALEKSPENGTVWDLGTGSGIIAITISLERPDIQVFASDISAAALSVAQKNATLLSSAVVFGCGSWFHAAEIMGFQPKSCDVIVCNPPYINHDDLHLSKGDLRFEPIGALTDFSDGLSHFRELSKNSIQWLKKEGWIMVEHGYDQAAKVQEIFIDSGFRSVETLKDLAGLDRVTIGQSVM